MFGGRYSITYNTQYVCVSCMSSTVAPEDSVKMPQTNKSASGGSVPGQVSAPDQGEPPPPPQDDRTQVAAGDGGGGGAAEDQGDPEIVKSPSDPKKYRWERTGGWFKCQTSDRIL